MLSGKLKAFYMEKARISNMTREQYNVQVASAKKELRRLKDEVKTLKKELDKAILDHKIVQGYEKTVNVQWNL